MREANKSYLRALPYREKDPKRAMEYYKEGIDILNELKEEAQNIEDDTVASNAVYYFLTTVGVMVIVAGVAIIGAMAGSPAISAVPAGMLGYKLLNMHNKHITGLKSAEGCVD